MPELSRSQLLVYGAVAVTLLLVGARWIRSTDQRGSPPGGVSAAATASESTGSEEEDATFPVASAEDGVVIHVAGAVRDPGVYRLPAGSRVTDAVKRAGGTAGRAVLDGINLAAALADGQQVVVPAAVKSGSVAMQGATSAAADGPISLGTATVEQLDTIEGIGPVTAQHIVEYRDQHGGLSSVEELDEISGIGPATMEALRARLQP